MALKVLFIDDEPDVLKLFKTLVEPLGCEVLALADSDEAAQRLKREKFDGVFVDARMPQLDGFELTRTARESQMNSQVPIVMLTGSNDAATMRRGFEAGVTFFLGKPLSQQRLLLLLKTMRGALLREKRRYARLPLRMVVTCRLDGRMFKAESVDISEGGILLAKSGGVAQGQELDLEFIVPGALRPLKARAKVVRKESPDQIAVRFLVLKIEDREAIQSFISGRITE